MLSEKIRELRRILRYRNHIVRTAVKMQNKMSGLLMEVGITYSKKRLHGKKYFHELLERVDDIPPSVKELLQLSRSSYEMFRSFLEATCCNTSHRQPDPRAGAPSHDHSRCRRDNGTDLGIRDWRS